MQFFTLLAPLVAATAVYAQVTVTPISASGTPIATSTVIPVVPTTSSAPVAVVTPVATAVVVSTYVVSSFTTVCATIGTFYYADVCYTATAISQTITAKCPCTLTTTVGATPTPAIAYVTAGANNLAAGGMMGALAVGAAALVL